MKRLKIKNISVNSTTNKRRVNIFVVNRVVSLGSDIVWYAKGYGFNFHPCQTLFDEYLWYFLYLFVIQHKTSTCSLVTYLGTKSIIMRYYYMNFYLFKMLVILPLWILSPKSQMVKIVTSWSGQSM